MAVMPCELQKVRISPATLFVYRAHLCQQIADTTSLRLCLYVGWEGCLSVQVKARLALVRVCIGSILFHSFCWSKDTSIIASFRGKAVGEAMVLRCAQCWSGESRGRGGSFRHSRNQDCRTARYVHTSANR
jgi:hypothetical protein